MFGWMDGWVMCLAAPVSRIVVMKDTPSFLHDIYLFSSKNHGSCLLQSCRYGQVERL